MNKKVDPATEFLRAHGFGPGGKPLQGKAAAHAVPSTLPAGLKPQYKGSFVGQAVTLGRVQDVAKRVAWSTENADGTEKLNYGRVYGWREHIMVWNGTDWVTKEQYYATK